MKNFLFIFLACLMMFSCKEKNTDQVDIINGLVVDIPLDGFPYDNVSQTAGSILGSTVDGTNRYGEPSKAMGFRAHSILMLIWVI